MAQWMLYVISIVAAGIVVYLLSHLSYEGQATSVNAANFEIVKKRQFAAIQTLERDFRNMGASKQSMANVITGRDNTCGPGSPSDLCTISFWTRVDDDTLLNDPTVGLFAPANQDSIEVRYEWAYEFTAGGVRPDRSVLDPDATETVPLLRWRRYLRPAGGAWAQTHELVSLTDFQVVPFTASGDTVTADSLTRQFYIELAALTPYGIGKDKFDISRWETFIRPVNLTRLDQ